MFDESDGVTHRLKDWADLIFSLVRLFLLGLLLTILGVPLFFVAMLGIKLVVAMFF